MDIFNMIGTKGLLWNEINSVTQFMWLNSSDSLEAIGQVADHVMSAGNPQRLGMEHCCGDGVLLPHRQGQQSTEAGIKGGRGEVLKGQPGREQQRLDHLPR